MTKIQILTAFCVCLFLPLAYVHAQGSVTLSVTPTLFQMNADPGQVWQSNVKVVNSNPFELTVYTEPVNFKPVGEGGTGKFIPVLEAATEGSTLAEWIGITRDAVVIPPETSMDIPFTVDVPEDAAPGGHFAAIMVSTRPPDADTPGIVKTAQAVSSLFFVRLAGDVIEEGTVREFTTEKKIVQDPKVDFIVRFQNTGNVHIQPQGDIKIFNMWGKERGVIPINQQTNFGSVLPDSIRRFDFTWRGESAFTEFGRFRAELTLGYGQDGKKFVTSATYFWVVPLKEVGITLGIIIAIFLFVTWAVRAYVRRMLSMAGIDPRLDRSQPFQSRYASVDDAHTVRVGKLEKVSAPVRSGVLDLKSRLTSASTFVGRIRSVLGFITSYRIFFIALLALVAALYAIIWFISDARTEERAYEITIDNPDKDITISSEEIIYNQESGTTEPISATKTFDVTEDEVEVRVVNVSGIPGTGAAMRRYLEDRDYTVTEVTTEFEREDARTVIVFPIAEQDAAVELSKRLDNALVSVGASTTNMITVFVGSDFTR